jgi:5'-nucleotidase (lipoprotein e(P4) family)
MITACLSLLASACATTPQAAVETVQLPANPPASMQYLYGSGEAGALSIQTFHALLDYAADRARRRPADSVVLAGDATIGTPAFIPCGDKPLAAVFDVDETLVLNAGFEYFDAHTRRGFDDSIWDRWEKTGAGKVAPVPGAVYAIDGLRKLGVTVVFNTNRSAANAEQAAEAIRNAGLGSAVHGETLFLKGDDAMGSKKDGRRTLIASRYCVIAMGGDQLGDFSDLFNEISSVPDRRMAAIRGTAAKMWGDGWFVLPNPVYGSALNGGFDDIFPLDKRWDDPAAKEQ